MPADWYIFGYDMFAMHTFLRLSRTGEETDGYLKTFFEQDYKASRFFVDFAIDFPLGKGLWNYLKFKSRLFLTSLGELLCLLALIKTISSLFQRSVMEVYKSSRGSNRLVLNFTSFQKLYIFSIMMVMPNFLSSELRVPLVSVTMMAY